MNKCIILFTSKALRESQTRSEWEKIKANDTSDRRWISKIHKELIQLNITGKKKEKTQMWKTLLPLLKMKKKGQHLLFVVFLMIAILLGMRSISLWLWFAFPQQWVMLNIFSCACWPSVCLLCRDVYLGLLPIFLSG